MVLNRTDKSTGFRCSILIFEVFLSKSFTIHFKISWWTYTVSVAHVSFDFENSKITMTFFPLLVAFDPNEVSNLEKRNEKLSPRLSRKNRRFLQFPRAFEKLWVENLMHLFLSSNFEALKYLTFGYLDLVLWLYFVILS